MIGEGFCLAASAVSELDDTPTSAAVGAGSLPDDAFIDQKSGLVAHDLYLRLAHAGVFKSKKIGKLVVARWGNVRAALVQTEAGAAESNQARDDLDELRRSLGFVPKSRA
jgi:hypothetical protein